MAFGSDRLFLIPLESRIQRVVIVGLGVGVATWLAILAIRPAIAEWVVGRATRPADFERAVAWDPKNPALRALLGHAYAGANELARAEAEFQIAIRLQPGDASHWLNVALLADRQRDIARSRFALSRALELDRHNVQIRWEAALLFLRWRERDAALEHFRYVVAVDHRQRDAAFQLARTLLRPGEDPASLLPTDRDGITNVLAAAVANEDFVLAEAAWTRRLDVDADIPEKLVRTYLELLLGEGYGLMARRVWPALVASAAEASPPDSRVWNGGFEAERLLGWGMDWHIQRVWGVDAALDRFVAAKGNRSLRLTFSSFPTLDYAGVFQLVAVEPGREYRLHALVKASEFVTASGLKLQIVWPKADDVMAETSAVAGTTVGWVPVEARVRIPKDTTLVAVRVRREPAPAPEGNLTGKVWLDEVSLQ